MRKALFVVLLSVLTAAAVSAKPEHFGGRFEIMNLAGINLYGIGSYTHTKWIDAEILFYFNLRSLSFGFLGNNKDYISHWATFAFKCRPLQFPPFKNSRLKPYVGAGTFPFILRGYTLHLTAGFEWVQKNDIALDINVKRFFTKESAVFEWLPGDGSNKAGLWALCLGIRL